MQFPVPVMSLYVPGGHALHDVKLPLPKSSLK